MSTVPVHREHSIIASCYWHHHRDDAFDRGDGLSIFKTVINVLGHVCFLFPTPTQFFLLARVRFRGKASSSS